MSHRTARIRTVGIRTLVSFALLTPSHCWHSHCWLRTGVIRTSVFRTLVVQACKYETKMTVEKEIVREVARGDKPYLRKSSDRKAQITKTFVQLSGLICALRSADFLR